MPYEKLNFVGGQILKADHLNHIESGFENIRYSDIKDKPTKTVGGIEIEGHTIYNWADEKYVYNSICKVSDEIPTVDDFVHGCTMKLYTGEVVEISGDDIVVGNGDLGVDADNIIKPKGNNYFVIIPEDTLRTKDNILLTAGTYFGYKSFTAGTTSNGYGMTHYYLSIPATEIVPNNTIEKPIIHNADAGKVVLVKTVNALNMPIEYECVDYFDGNYNNLREKPTEMAGFFVQGPESTAGLSMVANDFYHISDSVPTLEDLESGLTVTHPSGDIVSVPYDKLLIDSRGPFQPIDSFENTIFTPDYNVAFLLEDKSHPYTSQAYPKGTYVKVYEKSLNYTIAINARERIRKDLIEIEWDDVANKPFSKASAVADAAGDTPTAAEFNALLTALRNAGYLAT